MAFKVSGMKRDYLARDILLSLLTNPNIDKFFLSTLAGADGISLLATRSIELADDFLKGLGVLSLDDSESDTPSVVGLSLPIVLDAELDG